MCESAENGAFGRCGSAETSKLQARDAAFSQRPAWLRAKARARRESCSAHSTGSWQAVPRIASRICEITGLALLSAISVFVLSGCDRRGSEEQPEYVFKLANVLAEKDVTGYGANKFAEIVAEKSGGRIRIEVFHGGQLGSGIETFEAVKNGHLDMAADSFANLANITNAFEVFHLPFLFESRAQMLAAFQSDGVRKWTNGELSKANLQWLATFEIGGPRQVATSRRKIASALDLSGLKFRASRSPLEIATQESWGAKGVTVDWPETPEALRLGMVDGLTVPYASLYSARFHEGGLVRYILDLNFQSYALVVLVNERKWKALPSDIRDILGEAAREAEAWHVNFLGEYISRNIAEIAASGVEIYTWRAEEIAKVKTITKDRVWSEFVGGSGISRKQLKLIMDEIETVEGTGWGYRMPATDQPGQKFSP
jgi:TRAP-type C4-dicarboxylate transport system substrate-binding protein